MRLGGGAATAVTAESDVTTFSYSMVGLQPGADLLLWSLAPSLDALEARSASVLRSGMGKWMHVSESFLGIIQPSQYVKKPTPQEQSLFSGERSRYLVVYPFTKSTEWYLQGREARQGIMNEHMRVGHDFPEVRQLLANSFGIDDMDFLVAYETDDLARSSASWCARCAEPTAGDPRSVTRRSSPGSIARSTRSPLCWERRERHQHDALLA